MTPIARIEPLTIAEAGEIDGSPGVLLRGSSEAVKAAAALFGEDVALVSARELAALVEERKRFNTWVPVADAPDEKVPGWLYVPTNLPGKQISPRESDGQFWRYEVRRGGFKGWMWCPMVIPTPPVTTEDQ